MSWFDQHINTTAGYALLKNRRQGDNVAAGFDIEFFGSALELAYEAIARAEMTSTQLRELADLVGKAERGELNIED